MVDFQFEIDEETGVTPDPAAQDHHGSSLDATVLTNGYHGDQTQSEHDKLSDDSKVKNLHNMTQSDHDKHVESDHHSENTSSFNEPQCSPKSQLSRDDLVAGDEERTTSHIVDDKQVDVDDKKVIKMETTLSEQARIEELLARSDTAVIYPEPVSDHEHGERRDDDDGDEVGDGEYLLKCPHCGKGFTRVYLLKEHVTSQHADKTSTHMCPECGVSFAIKSHLDKHISLHSATAQTCKVCSKTFANVYRLSRHMISHEESTELRKFKCPDCGKAFKFKHHLKEHCRIHSGEKPFECSNCGKRFSHSGSYSSHTTSKKCWVMNLKMKRTGGGAPVADKSDTSGTILPPLVPKADDVMVESMTSFLQSGLVAASTAPMVNFDPAQLHHAQFVNGARPSPYLTPGHITSAHLAAYTGGAPVMTSAGVMTGLPSIPPVPSQLQALLDKKDMLLQIQNAVTRSSHLPEVKATSPLFVGVNSNSSPSKYDENQNKAEKLSPPTENAETRKIKQEILVAETRDQGRDEEMGVTDVEQGKTVKESENTEVPSPNVASGCSLSDLAAAAEVMEKMATGENRGDGTKDSPGHLVCRFCKTVFDSAVDHHQHERYLCDENTEIQRKPKDSRPVLTPPVASRKSEDSESGSGDSDIRKCRARSLISEDQHQVLRAFFQTNPRPGKSELELLAKKINFPKRVVQVWFQNQRARIRRKGSLLSPGVHVPAEPERGTIVSASPYIPVVPQVPVRSHDTSVRSPSAAQLPVSPGGNIQVEPLDLSTSNRIQPQEAHINKPFSKTSPVDTTFTQVLNLSKKSSDTDTDQCSRDADSLSPGSVSEPMTPTPRHLPSPSTLNPRSLDSVIVTSHYDRLLTSTPHMASPAHLHPASPIPTIPSPAQALTFHPAAMDTSYDTSLMTGLKPKRARKKSWRQMESDAFHMDYDSIIDDDDDDDDDDDNDSQGFPRKRRSWKQHRLDGSGEGLYVCDQCDKFFNKQSSLARHKYEHSGQRPFPCDVCTKAFKHKHHLTEHKRLHSGEKPFACKKCGKKFSHSGSYSQHMNHRYKYCKPLRLGVGRDEQADVSNEGMSE